jgi:hypothetical protein
MGVLHNLKLWLTPPRMTDPVWRSECDSHSQYRFEFRNPRRLRNWQAV